MEVQGRSEIGMLSQSSVSRTVAPVVDRRWFTLGRIDSGRVSVDARPLPQRLLHPDGAATRFDCGEVFAPLDFTDGIRRLCEDIANRCPDFFHIDPSLILFSCTAAKSRGRHGLLARTTPMRFRDGEIHRRHRGVTYRLQRFYVDGREMLYLVTFCLPRFLDQSFEEKMITVFHELYHINPRFDGDLRRLGGRCKFHSRSKKAYDELMERYVRKYLARHPNPTLFSFLRRDAKRLRHDHGGIVGTMVPRPMMLPIGH